MSKPIPKPRYVAPRFTDSPKADSEPSKPEIEALRERVEYLERHLALVERMVRAIKKA
jgi:hypothetical protein